MDGQGVIITATDARARAIALRACGSQSSQ
jgi:hypothetical protein